jgi:acetate---CoA ligase (ADP-forming)
VISTGNEADVDCAALIDEIIDDPNTRAVALFIETVRNPDLFIAASQRALAAGKPIVVLKAGVSEVTAQAATAHTGALVGDDNVFDAICKQFAVIRVQAIEDLLATADIVSRIGVLKPGGLCVISNSGGICEIAADRAHRSGLAMTALSDTTKVALRDVLPEFGTPHNPLDLTGAFRTEQGEAAVRIMADEADCAAVLCPWYEVPTHDDDVNPRLMDAYTSLAKGLNGAAAPGLLVSYTATHVTDAGRKIIADLSLPYVACGLDRADLYSFPAGQAVGTMTEETSVREVMYKPQTEYAEAIERMSALQGGL